MLWRWLRGTPCPMGVTFHWKNNKLAQADPLRWSRDVRGIQKGQVAQAQPETPNCAVIVATELSLGSTGTQGRGWSQGHGSPPPLHFLVSLQQKPGSKDNLHLPLCSRPEGESPVKSTRAKRLDSESSAACSAMCKKNVDHFTLNSITDFALIVFSSAETVPPT